MDWFSKDGAFTKFCEGLPVVGYVASAGHAIAGDEDRARRAAAAGTNGLLTTAGAVGGGIVGGPAGAVAGATLGSSAGQLSEHGINHTTNCKTDKGDFSRFNAENFVFEAGVSGIATGMSGGVGKDVSRQVVGQSLKGAGGGGIGRYAVKRGVESAVGGATKTTMNYTRK